MEPLAHYLQWGSAEGRYPNRLFNPNWYRSHHKDTAATGAEPLAHYLLFGSSEGRRPIPELDPAWYLAEYPEVAIAGIEPLAHYLKQGLEEGRDPNPDWGDHSQRRRLAVLGLSNPLRPARVAVGIVTYNNSVSEQKHTVRSAAIALETASGNKPENAVFLIDNGAPTEDILS